MRNYLKGIVPALIGSALIIGGCSDEATQGTNVNSEDLISKYVSYSSEDAYTDWSEDNVTYVHLDGASATFDGDGGVVVENQQIQIRTTGTYVLDGNFDDGQIVVDTEDTGTVRLVLNGVAVSSSTSAPIYIKQADKAVISLEENTENTFTDAKEYLYEDNSTEPDAAIFSNDDLTINGPGTLTVNANYQDGIKSDDELLITGGQIHVTSADDGVVGKDLLAVKEATLSVKSVGDGVKSSNTEDEEKGNIVLESGSITIQSEGDGIQAEKALVVTDGQYTITTAGGSPETIESTEEFGMGGQGNMQGGMGDFDASIMIDRMLEGIEVSDEVRERLLAAESFEDLQTILQEYPEIQEQLQQSGMEGRGGGPGQSGEMPQMPGAAQGSGDSTDGQQQTVPQMPGTENDLADQAAPNGEETSADTTAEGTVSTKGVKAGTELIIAGGTFTIDSLEDAIHSNGTVAISGGEMTVNTGDDGIHADTEVVITGGKLSVEKSYEGLEGKNITITDGTIHLVATDDGINVNSQEAGFGQMGDGMFAGNETDQAAVEETAAEEEATEAETEEGNLLIEGGYVYVNAAGDGLDSNNTAKMTGGTVSVYGPTNSGNGALDYDKTFEIEGGTLIAAGSSGMAQGISDSSSQNAIMMTFTDFQQAGTTVYVENSDGEQVFAIAPEKEFQTILISTPELKMNETYTLSAGGTLTGEATDGLYEKAEFTKASQSVEFALSTVMTYVNESGVTESPSNMMGGFGGGQRGGIGGGNPFTSSEDSEENSKANQ